MSELAEIVGESVNLAEQGNETQQAKGQQTEQAQGGEQAGAEGQQAEQQEQKPDTRTVPLAALHEERQKRREIQQEIQRLREDQQRRDTVLEQRLATLAQAKQAEQTPSFEEDPAGHLRHGQAQIQQGLQLQQQQMAQWHQQQQQEAAFRNLTNAVMSHEAQFVAQAPDYADAVKYLHNQIAAEIVADGADPEHANQEASNRLKLLAYQKAQQGQNPAESAYRIAQARGYSKKTAEQTPAQRLESQQKGVSVAKSLGNGGSSSQNKLSIETLASMSDEEFAEATAGNKWNKLMG